MAKFKSRKDAEEALLDCIYKIKEILNKDLSFTNHRKRTCSEWFKNFGKSEAHLETKGKLIQLEELRRDAATFILFNLESLISPGDQALEETWIQ